MNNYSGSTAVAGRLHSAAIHLLRRLRKQDAATGLSAARASALSVLVFGGPTTIGRLARAEQVSAPTMTRLLVGMERDGLSRREPDRRDRRVTWVRATARGARILHEARRRRVHELAGELARLDPADLDMLDRAAAILERISGGAANPDVLDKARTGRNAERRSTNTSRLR